jgi:hypothetical protein
MALGIGVALALGALVFSGYQLLRPLGRYVVTVRVQALDGKQVLHEMHLLANGGNDAAKRVLRKASRRFKGCGVTYASHKYEGYR